MTDVQRVIHSQITACRHHQSARTRVGAIKGNRAARRRDVTVSTDRHIACTR